MYNRNAYTQLSLATTDTVPDVDNLERIIENVQDAANSESIVGSISTIEANISPLKRGAHKYSIFLHLCNNMSFFNDAFTNCHCHLTEMTSVFQAKNGNCLASAVQ